jgi:hypothetical protein
VAGCPLQVSPAPLVTPVPLSLAGATAAAEQAPVQLEEEAIRAALCASQLKACADVAEGEALGISWQLVQQLRCLASISV